MKMRIRGNTLRLRLTRGEVAEIEAGNGVSEQTHFPDGSILRYEMVPGQAQAAGMQRDGDVQVIRIEVPRGAAAEWAAGDEVGLTGDGPFNVGPMAVLIEKDFTCITPRTGEEEADTYPNPNALSA